jgi:Outer membrane lipoprotein-sorting protein
MDMKPYQTVVLTFLLISNSSPVDAATKLSNSAGVKLAQLVYDRPTGKDFSSKVIMRLQKRQQKPRQRVLYSYAKDMGKSERWTLMRFVEPRDVSGTGLLTLDHPGDKSDQWLYLPALDRVRRISSSRKGGRFVGSDFYYEDLMDREVGMDYHFLKGKGRVGKIPCDILISTPKKSRSSIYSKRLSCIHRRTRIPISVDYYKRGNDKPIKRLRARKIKKVQGFWTVFDSTMYDLRTGHKTQLFTTRVKYNQGMRNSLFSQRSLSDDSNEKAFRP